MSDIKISVRGQQLYPQNQTVRFAPGSQKFVKFAFLLDDSWAALTKTFVQFSQGDTNDNQYLDSDNCAYLPKWIKPGQFTIALGGSAGEVEGTTAPVYLRMGDEGVVANAESTEVTESLYAQLVETVAGMMSFDGESAEKIQADVQANRTAAETAQANAEAEAAAAEAARIKAEEALGYLSVVDGMLCITYEEG